jgi:hypothetical protein
VATAQPGDSARAEVEVTVSPGTAFRAFTEEIGQWWVPGPINFFDAARATGMRIEPWLGGRVLESYGAEDPLVIATVTGWVPGEQLTLRGVVDDTETQILFEPTSTGTRVRVHQFVLPGADRAFLFWPNVIVWLVAYLSRTRRPTPVTEGEAT